MIGREEGGERGATLVSDCADQEVSSRANAYVCAERGREGGRERDGPWRGVVVVVVVVCTIHLLGMTRGPSSKTHTSRVQRPAHPSRESSTIDAGSDTPTPTHTRMHTRTHTHTHTSPHTRSRMHTRARAYIRTYTYAYTEHAHTTHTRTHTQTRTHTP